MKKKFKAKFRDFEAMVGKQILMFSWKLSGPDTTSGLPPAAEILKLQPKGFLK
ncbi:MAG: hypothetical protein NTX98_01495 [Candidatus Doudnabacteria bacterium]|nr:hypothetical protein [Candidatus Doudnabacteria bacterium]